MTLSVSDSLVRSACWLRRAAGLMMLLIVWVNVLAWLSDLDLHSSGWLAVIFSGPSPFDVNRWTALAALSLVSLALLWGFWRLWQLTELFMAGEFFSVRAVLKLRAFASSLVLAVVGGLLIVPLLQLLLSLWVSVPGSTQVTLNLSAADLLSLLMALLLRMITAIMAEARRLDEDSAQIV